MYLLCLEQGLVYSEHNVNYYHYYCYCCYFA